MLKHHSILILLLMLGSSLMGQSVFEKPLTHTKSLEDYLSVSVVRAGTGWGIQVVPKTSSPEDKLTATYVRTDWDDALDIASFEATVPLKGRYINLGLDETVHKSVSVVLVYKGASTGYFFVYTEGKWVLSDK